MAGKAACKRYVLVGLALLLFGGALHIFWREPEARHLQAKSDYSINNDEFNSNGRLMPKMSTNNLKSSKMKKTPSKWHLRKAVKQRDPAHSKPKSLLPVEATERTSLEKSKSGPGFNLKHQVGNVPLTSELYKGKLASVNNDQKLKEGEMSVKSEKNIFQKVVASTTYGTRSETLQKSTQRSRINSHVNAYAQRKPLPGNTKSAPQFAQSKSQPKLSPPTNRQLMVPPPTSGQSKVLLPIGGGSKPPPPIGRGPNLPPFTDGQPKAPSPVGTRSKAPSPVGTQSKATSPVAGQPKIPSPNSGQSKVQPSTGGQSKIPLAIGGKPKTSIPIGSKPKISQPKYNSVKYQVNKTSRVNKVSTSNSKAVNQIQPQKLPTKSIADPSLENSAAHWLDGTINGRNTARKRVDVTAAFSKDSQLKRIADFKIEALVAFFPNVTTQCNQDKTCYENWLAMDFPPNADWDRTYRTPCYHDYMTARFRCIPHFYMVGWAKSGTTDIWWYLQQHPQLVHGYKETQFLTQFSFWEDHKHMKTFDQLLKYYFDERSLTAQKNFPKKIMYDATATIIYDNWHWRIKQGYRGDPNIPTHTNFHYLRKIHSGAEIAVVMRNPVTRALSFYNHGVDMSIKKNANLQFTYLKIPRSPEDIHEFFVDSIYYFNECVKKTSLRACCHMSGWESQNWGDPKYFMTLRIGIYYVFLEEVYKNYPPRQVHLLKAEEFYDTPVPTLNGLFGFLNITTRETETMVKMKGDRILMKVKKYFTPLKETYKLLQAFYAPYNKRLATMLGEEKWLLWESQIDQITRDESTN